MQKIQTTLVMSNSPQKTSLNPLSKPRKKAKLSDHLEISNPDQVLQDQGRSLEGAAGLQAGQAECLGSQLLKTRLYRLSPFFRVRESAARAGNPKVLGRRPTSAVLPAVRSNPCTAASALKKDC